MLSEASGVAGDGERLRAAAEDDEEDMMQRGEGRKQGVCRVWLRVMKPAKASCRILLPEIHNYCSSTLVLRPCP
jgi:hypothetical protein